MKPVQKSNRNKLKINLEKEASIKLYYIKVQKGAPPEQTRKDCGLSLEEIQAFDFSIFHKNGITAEQPQ